MSVYQTANIHVRSLNNYKSVGNVYPYKQNVCVKERKWWGPRFHRFALLPLATRTSSKES